MAPPKKHPAKGTAHPGFFSIFPILAKLLWRYGRRLFSVETIAALEKKQGPGSGERTVEEELLEQALQRNKHHYHVTDHSLNRGPALAKKDLTNPVLVVRKGGHDERHR